MQRNMYSGKNKMSDQNEVQRHFDNVPPSRLPIALLEELMTVADRVTNSNKGVILLLSDTEHENATFAATEILKGSIQRMETLLLTIRPYLDQIRKQYR